MSDLSSDCKPLADQYYAYLNAGDFTSAQKLLTDNPTLSTMILNASKINYYTDIAISLERFFKDNVETYLETTFSYRGTYNASTTYVKGNIIDYSGEGFICRVTSSTGVSPTAHTITTNWAVIAKQGIQGVSGTGLAPRGVWNSTTQYYANDCVADNNVLWQCVTGNTNSEPTVSNANWISLLSMSATSISLTGYVKPDSTSAVSGADNLNTAIGKLEKDIDSKANVSHKSTHALGGTDALSASDIGALPVNGGAMTGVLQAQSNTSYTTSQVRNIVYSTSAPSGGNNGDLWIRYV